jgi:hypothetical protein
MTPLVDLLNKQNDNQIKIKDVINMMNNVEKISKDTKNLNTIAKDITSFKSDIKKFITTATPGFLEKNETAYESKLKVKGVDAKIIKPTDIGDNKDESSHWLRNTLGAGIIGGIATYFISPDFKNKVDEIINNFGESMFGKVEWEHFKLEIVKKYDDLSGVVGTKILEIWDKVEDDMSEGISDMFESAKSIWNEHWKEILAGMAALSMILRPMHTLAASVKLLTNSVELFKSVGGTQGIVRMVVPFLTTPAVIAGISGAVLSYLGLKASKSFTESDTGVEGLTSPDTVSTVTDPNIINARIEYLSEELPKKSPEDKIKTQNEILDLESQRNKFKAEDLKNILQNKLETSQREDIENRLKSISSKIKTPEPVKSVLDKNVEFKTPLVQPIQPTPIQQSPKAEIAQSSATPMKIAEYEQQFGTTYASTEPIPYKNSNYNNGPELLKEVLNELNVRDEQLIERIFSLARTESSLNPTAEGPVIKSGIHKGDRAQGLLQIMPKTAKEVGFTAEEIKSDAKKAALAGVKYFLKNYERFNKNLDAATVAHHAGPGGAMKYLATGSSGTSDVNMSTDAYLAKIKGPQNGDFVTKRNYKTPDQISNEPSSYITKQDVKDDSQPSFLSSLLSQAEKIGVIDKSQFGKIESDVNSQIEKIRSEMKNFIGTDLNKISSELKDSQAKMMKPESPNVTNVTNNNNNINNNNSSSGSGDIPNPFDIDISKLIANIA